MGNLHKLEKCDSCCKSKVFAFYLASVEWHVRLVLGRREAVVVVTSERDGIPERVR